MSHAYMMQISASPLNRLSDLDISDFGGTPGEGCRWQEIIKIPREFQLIFTLAQRNKSFQNFVEANPLASQAENFLRSKGNF
ncbi:MAG: hypothetical protein Kow0042_22790 [Calditrichia bacterium]